MIIKKLISNTKKIRIKIKFFIRKIYLKSHTEDECNLLDAKKLSKKEKKKEEQPFDEF